MFTGTSGVYRIRNLINGKFYIGSAVDFSNRWGVHLHKLSKNKHHCSHLQHSWNKHGGENFVFEIVEECDPIKRLLLQKEQFYIDSLLPEYNICEIAGSTLGYKMSDESKAKMSVAKKGRKLSQETKDKLSKLHLGRKYSDAIRLKMKNASMSRKEILRICPTTKEILDSYVSTKEASEKLGIKTTSISNALNKRSKMSGGFLWEFKN